MAAASSSGRSGGLLQKVAFTSDSKFLLCCSGCVVKCFSATTGAPLRLLDGHSDEVTGVAHNPASPLQAYTASLDGRILLWDLDEAIVLRTICVGLPIVALAVDPASPDTGFILTGPSDTALEASVPDYCREIAQHGRVYSVALRVSGKHAARSAALLARAREAAAAAKKGGAAAGKKAAAAAAAKAADAFGSAEMPWPADLKLLFKAAKASALAAGPCGHERTSVVGAVSGRYLYLHDVAKGTTAEAVCPSKRQMRCLAISPAEPLCATGDETGRIHLWHLDGGGAAGGGGGKAPAPRSSEMHWHAQRVAALGFSPNGAYLYSVGKEGVLVSWQLHTANRSFIPRLGAPLTALAIASSGNTAAALGGDNAIRLVDLQANHLKYA